MTSDSLPKGPPMVKEYTNGSSLSQGLTGIDVKCDVLVVGAGFSGITAIHRFRKVGKTVKCFESGGDFGGVWYWNRYPGARVDSETPFYQLNIPEVYRGWNFAQRFPDHVELRKYMAHVDNVLNLRKDVYFHARVSEASWDADQHVWTVKTQQGHRATCRYLVCCTGLLHRTYTPDFPGLKNFKGELYHSGAWPEGYTAHGKRVAIIGAGATAVQITQELGKEADHLTVLLRRPSYCLPMRQRQWTVEEQNAWRSFYPSLFQSGRASFTGFPLSRQPVGVYDVPEEERLALFEELWGRGAFHFGLGNYNNIALDKKANQCVYEFWKKKVRERLTDPEKQKIMAPDNPPYYYGTKRNPLEHDYYEVLNQPNVSLHNLNANPLKSFHEKGLLMSDGSLLEFDTVVLATGFDSYTGSLTQMGIKNKNGVDLKDEWKGGVHTYLGMTVAGFPNFFMSYTPQAPTALSNGTTIIEAQIETIVDMIEKLESEGGVAIEPTVEAETQWRHMITEMAKFTLFPYTDSWWNSANIPGKQKETGNLYIGGIENYEKQCRATLDGWQGFDVVTTKA